MDQHNQMQQQDPTFFINFKNHCRFCGQELQPHQILNMNSICDAQAGRSFFDCHQMCSGKDLRQCPNSAQPLCNDCGEKLKCFHDYCKAMAKYVKEEEKAAKAETEQMPMAKAQVTKPQAMTDTDLMAKHETAEKDGQPVPHFTCKICHKAFKQKRYLNRHLHLHDANRPFHGCQQCNSMFANKFSLSRHVKNQHCDFCEKKFGVARCLKIHTKENQQLATSAVTAKKT
ncbi:zinc finger protein 845 [Drosophila persimilis]|uniref:zinc finger protein 845 n=1 Tax=Drosophila persimilis TaxID=7234 RepID=UPI000F08658B|nr:zinc finger protein 845 [Drosophila persimilis]